MREDVDLISRWDAIEALSKAMPSLNSPDGSHPADHDIQMAQEAFVDAIVIVRALPSVQPDKEYIEQIKWERDVAVQQLKELGYSLGERIRADEWAEPRTELYGDGFNDGYKAGWEDGRDALREEIWADERDRFD